ncbi:hypothetical protein [Niabella hibiscisoli]|uniref:hypothetical protein n=1 Tax=Niabella hibiscisoli TaxID=1825928 RepID=UPI001F100932|nr:hypothetical protein [Niabella hibiscisoli]MCH5716900.1 hypothetical protein [Niabella hibiscisoli]
MVDITHIQNKSVQVENYQTTFLTLKVDGRLFRLDFIDKKEFKLKKGILGQLRIYETRPLLIDYNENIVTAYINSKPEHFDDFVADFANAINEITKGWRSWANYVTDRKINSTLNNFLNNVKRGIGKLMEAPFSITQIAIKVCDKHNVATKMFGNELKRENFKLMLIGGDNYVIAKEFRIRQN